MFDNIRITRRLKADAAKIGVPGSGAETEFADKKHRNLRATIRFAACTAVAAAVVLTGTLWLPGQHLQPMKKVEKGAAQSAETQNTAHDFTLVAYAAEASSSKKQKVVLKTNIKVMLPSGKLSYDRHSGQEDNGKWIGGSGFSGGSFTCSGKNLTRANYAARSGELAYRCSELIQQEHAASKRAVVCTFTIPKYKIDSAHLIKSFLQLWKSGTLDAYRKKYFSGKDIDFNRYSITIMTTKESYTEGSETGSFDFAYNADSNNDRIIIKDSKKYNFDNHLFLPKKSIMASASDHNALVNWSPSDTTWAGVKASDKKYESTGKIDYSTVPGDTITVKGTFSDGQKVTKYIELSFDKSGKLCAKLTDKQ